MESIKDRVAIAGMGIAMPGERWDQSHMDLMQAAVNEALADAHVGVEEIQAGWIGGAPASDTINTLLGSDDIPITQIENACATGGDVFRSASLAIASGAYDLVIAVGVGKQKDAGTTGIDMAGDPSTVGVEALIQNGAVPPHFALYATRYMHHYGYTYDELKRAMARIAVKNHANAMRNPRAYLRKEITIDEAVNSRVISWPLSLYDCCANVDGAACAILASPAVARRLRDDYVLVKGVGLASGWREGRLTQKYTFTRFPENELASQRAYAQAGIKDPVAELDHVQLHDAFTVNELVDYEDTGLAPRGQAPKLVMEGFFDFDGPMPVNTDGGLKCTGHPPPATGLKQLYECYHQVQGTAGERQIKNVERSMAHSQGGLTGTYSTIVTILGSRD
jgi:acetyl-CoA C-acetyltransferase